MSVMLGRYLHYKGKEYEVFANGLLESTLEPVVIYRALYSNSKSEVWVRAEQDFLGDVEHGGQIQPRFKKIS